MTTSHIVRQMPDTSGKWGNQMVLLFLSLKLTLFKWELGENQLYGLISNISFQSFTKGQITEYSSPPLHKAWMGTTNSHAISHGFSEIKQYILWKIIRGVPDRYCSDWHVINYSMHSKKQLYNSLGYDFSMCSLELSMQERRVILHTLCPCVCTLYIKYAIRFPSVMKKDVQLIYLNK